MTSRDPAVFEALGDPTRRTILQVLSEGDMTAGDIGRAIESAAPMSQPAVSQHLKVLRGAGLVDVQSAGTSRIYAIEVTGVQIAREWLAGLVASPQLFEQRLDSLDTEVARGKRQRKQRNETMTDPTQHESNAS